MMQQRRYPENLGLAIKYAATKVMAERVFYASWLAVLFLSIVLTSIVEDGCASAVPK